MTPTFENTNPIEQTAANASSSGGFFSFDKFITARLVKIIFVVGIALILLTTLIGAVPTLFAALDIFGHTSMSNGLSVMFFALLKIVIMVVGSLLAILLLRIYCEFIIVIFKINENLQVIRNRNGQL